MAKWVLAVQLPITAILLLMYIRVEMLLNEIMNNNSSMSLDDFWDKELQGRATTASRDTSTSSYCGAKH